MMVPVILCGGSGSRLWPVSRRFFPKQFHALTGELSLFQETVRRCAAAGAGADPVVLSNADYRFLVAEQLDDMGTHRRAILLEPAARNTAPAIALAALYIAQSDPGAVMLVAPADHLMRDEQAFAAAVRTGFEAAVRGSLVTLGIEPGHAATAYGYIRQGAAIEGPDPGACYSVDRFVEKPDEETASRFLAEGGYLWNSGIFLFSARSYLAELEKQQPDILNACERAWREASEEFGFCTAGEAYGGAPSLSIDYAVMEKTDKAVVVPYRGDWSDIGSWTGLADTRSPDEDGNTISGNVRLRNVTGSFVLASDRLVAGVGLEDTVIVETKDAVLVSTRKDDQDVKQVVEELKSLQAAEVDYHTVVFRPWGSFEDLDKGDGFHVKRLVIEPGASISLQRHFHRSEHWIVVEGEAIVVRDDEEFVLKKNESTDIPCRSVHKLTNRGRERLVIIEVQTGDYLDESDIERLKDDYGRS